ncbi:hypothetical protein FA15DRAFT_659598 [Coprinopsis marcescibilis]|uniref:Uncharacterized protein n=1 Tax=Coprinopsis marcescibilis TaxID=230819 RepID=A0A5C3KIB2_COPMA|nr:hypothetical protein FA15DRAFT_659598 [Coprinopsis marcescibilis]
MPYVVAIFEVADVELASEGRVANEGVTKKVDELQRKLGTNTQAPEYAEIYSRDAAQSLEELVDSLVVAAVRSGLVHNSSVHLSPGVGVGVSINQNSQLIIARSRDEWLHPRQTDIAWRQAGLSSNAINKVQQSSTSLPEADDRSVRRDHPSFCDTSTVNLIAWSERKWCQAQALEAWQWQELGRFAFWTKTAAVGQYQANPFGTMSFHNQTLLEGFTVHTEIEAVPPFGG